MSRHLPTDIAIRYYRSVAIALLLLSLVSGCASPPHHELTAARFALEQAKAAQAQEYAPPEYSSASELVVDAEKSIDNNDYERAREELLRAKEQAETATRLAYENRVLSERRKAIIEEEKVAPPKKPEPPPKKVKTEKPAPKPVIKPSPPPPPPLPSTYTVGDGETLLTISAQEEIYNDCLLWPLLYKANRDQISDPRTIYPGQVLNIPRNSTEEELNDIREQARQSDIFPVEIQNIKQDSIQSQ